MMKQAVRILDFALLSAREGEMEVSREQWMRSDDSGWGNGGGRRNDGGWRYFGRRWVEGRTKGCLE